jgi:hypothetical protein
MDAFLLAKMSSHPQRNQIANEDTVEKIVRKRSLEGMLSANLQLDPCRRLMLLGGICLTNDRSVLSRRRSIQITLPLLPTTG